MTKDRVEWASGTKKVKALRGPYIQGVIKQVIAPRNGVQSFEMSQVSESEVVYLRFLKFDR
jgi:hypothetical protein